MHFSQFFKKLISFSLIFNFLFVYQMEAFTGVSNDINDTTRTVEVIQQMIQSGAPSDLPVAGVSSFFDKEHVHLIRNFDLSQYIGKKIFVGYGIYDTGQENCKFVEQPGVTELTYKTAFAATENFNQHSYAISMNRMDYSSCKALATQYGGTPVIIDSSAENMFMASKFAAKTISSTLVEKVWVGASRSDCTAQNYTNEVGMEQTFVNWVNSFDSLSCDPSKLNIKSNALGKWEKTGFSVPAFCVVEFDSEDSLKPLKVCAPWWKVIRDYPNQTPGLYNPELLKRINQADIPVELNICTLYSSDLPHVEETATRLAHCTEYYSATVAPECLDNIQQPQCKVNECQGYIQNACRIKQKEKVGKGYVKGEVLKNGVITEVRIKDEVYTSEYECPPSPPSNRYCLEDSTVVIYPQECPGSQCQLLKECILAVGTGGTQAQFDACYDINPCIKIYGSRDLPPVIDAAGEVTQLKGKCPDAPISDGSILTFDVNVQSRTNRRCLEYETFNRTEQITQNCVLERPFMDYSVDMSITQADIYENDPNCVRMDTAQESINMQDIAMSFTLNGYMKHKATKVFLDGNITTVFDGGTDLYTLGSAMPEVGAGRNTTVTSTDSNVTIIDLSSSSSNLDCSEFDPLENLSGIPTAPWYVKNLKVFNENTDNVDPNIININYSGTYGLIDLADSIIGSESDCSGYASAHEFGTYLNSYVYSKNPVTNVDLCQLKITKETVDNQFSEIYRISEDSMRYTFKDNMTGKNCLKKAICLDGYYNETEFSSLTSSGVCRIVTGEGTPSSYLEILSAEIIQPTMPPPIDTISREMCMPTSETQNASSSLDGIQNIFVFEDYVRGGFGYYSNFNSWPVLSNKATISSGNFMDKNLPIQEMNRIGDFMQYHGIYTHESHKAKQPDIPLALAGGVLAGTAAVLLAETLLLTGGIIGLVVFIVILLFMSKSKNMDRQYTEWHVYKDIPNDLYDLSTVYETRLTGNEAEVVGEKSLHSNPVGFKRMTYWHLKTDTGRNKPEPFKKVLLELLKAKQNTMVCGGVEFSEADRFTHPDERTINYGYPKCKWYNPWCTKCRCDQRAEIVTNNSVIGENVNSPAVPVVWVTPGNEVSKEKMIKDVGTVYLGATNNLMVLVPYAGDYKLEAYNKYDTLLSTRIIHESSFIGVSDPNDLKFAQVNFALGMNLAPGMENFGNEGACINDRSVEWGGGVSGVFFESQRTDLSNYCQKSHNAYVADQAMTKIFVQPLNMDRGFTLNLTKPMPFPNRVWIATLDNREVRNYRCYEEWPECSDNNFVEVGE